AALAAVLAVVALAVRQSLVLVRHAQALLGTGGGTPAHAVWSAAREQSPPVTVAVLVSAAAFLPAAVIGGPGLELLQPFAIALLGGLVTSTVVVLFLVPGLVAAVGGLRPPPVIGLDTPDGEPREPAVGHAKHAFHDNQTKQETGAVMRTARPYGIASLFVAGTLALAGCQSAAEAEEDLAVAPASVETAADGGPARLTLIEDAERRLGVATAPVSGQAGALSIPYAAVLYDADGGTWTFVELEPRVYQRAPITIAGVDGGTAVLSTGPEPGAAVVTVGAAELVGVEAGISGGE
ncbi:MAG: hypothetical protein JWP62_3640, partial [Blastococcus sp.]|nr:hypothetical protein [Blastococcus sp.]